MLFSNRSNISHGEQNSYLEIRMNAKLKSKEMGFFEVKK
jgi:hypothetical protein